MSRGCRLVPEAPENILKPDANMTMTSSHIRPHTGPDAGQGVWRWIRTSRPNTGRISVVSCKRKTPRNALPERDHIMTKRLLIDARQSEETRVVLLSGTRIEDFDYETENRKQLKAMSISHA